MSFLWRKDCLPRAKFYFGVGFFVFLGFFVWLGVGMFFFCFSFNNIKTPYHRIVCVCAGEFLQSTVYSRSRKGNAGTDQKS